MGISFIDPPSDAGKFPRSNVDHYLRRAFAALRFSLQEMHWSIVHAGAGAEHRRKLQHRKSKRGVRPDLGGAVFEMLQAIACERAEADAAEKKLQRMLWPEDELTAIARIEERADQESLARTAAYKSKIRLQRVAMVATRNPLPISKSPSLWMFSEPTSPSQRGLARGAAGTTPHGVALSTRCSQARNEVSLLHDDRVISRHVQVCLGSYQPSHEDKTAGVAFLLALWMDVEWPEDQRELALELQGDARVRAESLEWEAVEA